MSLTPTTSYYVTVDSQFRNLEKYPYDTDFGVTFQEPTSTGPFVTGLPISGGNNTTNNYFTPLQIDPDYISSYWKLTNGIITNFKQLSTGETFICGIMDNSGQAFTITYKGTTFVNVNPIQYDINGAFLIKFTEDFTYGTISFNWIVCLRRNPYISNTNEITRSTFDISPQNNIYFMFDFSCTEFQVKFANNSGTAPYLLELYTVSNPTNNNNICIATLGFDTNGNPLYSNNHNWGYHVLASSTDDLLQTRQNGRFGVKVDIAGNMYLNANTNPYKPTIYTAQQTGGGGDILYNSLYNTMYAFTNSAGTGYVTGYGPSATGNYVLMLYNTTSTLGVQFVKEYDIGSFSNYYGGEVAFAEDTTYVYTTTPWYIYRLDKTTLTYSNYRTLSIIHPAYGDPLWYDWGGDQAMKTHIVGTNLYICLAGSYSPYMWSRIFRIDLTTSGLNSATTGTYWTFEGRYLQGFDSINKGGTFYLSYTNADTYPPDVNDPLRTTNVTHLYTYDTTSVNPFVPLTFYSTGVQTTAVPCPTLITRSSSLYIVLNTNAGFWLYDITTSTPILINKSNFTQQFDKIYSFNTSTNYYLYTNNRIIDWTDPYNLYLVADNYPLTPDDITSYLTCLNSQNNFVGFYKNPTTNDTKIMRVQNIIKTTSVISYHYNRNLESYLGGLSTSAIDTLATSIQVHYLFYINSTNLYVSTVSNASTNLQIYSISFPSALTFSNSFYSDVKGIETTTVDSSLDYCIFVWDNSKVYLYSAITGMPTLTLMITLTPTNLLKILPFIRNNTLYFYMLYTTRVVELYSVTFDMMMMTATSNLEGTYTLENYLSNSILTGGDFWTYDNGHPYLFVYTTVQENYYGSPPIRSKLYVFDAWENLSIGPANSVAYNISLTFQKRSTNILKTPDNNIAIIAKTYSGVTYYLDVTDPYSISYKYISFWVSAYAGYVGLFNPGVYQWNNYDSAQFTIVHPVTKKVLSVQYTNGSAPSSINTAQTYITYVDTTDPNNVKLGSPYPMSYLSGVNEIKTLIIGQQVVAFFLNSLGNIIVQDFSDPDFASLYYRRVDGSYPAPVTTTYNNLQGIGMSFINKVDNLGNSVWLSSLGGNSSPYHSLNVNSSNITIDPSLSYIYVAGGWEKKIQTFNNYNTGSNLITSPNTNYNCFMTKIDIRDGSFVWLSPFIGNADDYAERIQYIPSLDRICLVAHFASTVLLIYRTQTSIAGGSFTNPNTILANISNSSSETSAIVTFDTSGNYVWNTLLFSTEELRYVKLYDITVDESTSSPSIQVIGLSNANTLQGLSSNKVAHQNLYDTSLDPTTQGYIFTYGYTLGGVYKYSNYTEYSPTITNFSIDDIKSFGSLNRILFFPNYKNSITGALYSYNRDGTLAETTNISPDILNLRHSRLIAYKYDPTYTDVNGTSYSKLVLQASTGSLPTGSLVNNYIYILGTQPTSIQQASNIVGPSSTIFYTDDTVLSKNFSIRSNTIDSNGKMNLILNQVVPIASLNRQRYYNTNYSSKELYWAGNIAKSQLNSVIYCNINVFGGYIQVYYNLGTAINPNNTYYLIFPYLQADLTYINKIVAVTNIVFDNITNSYNLYIANMNDLYADYTNTTRVGPYISLASYNASALYTLQFYPGSLNTITYFKISINRIIIPNRRVRNSPYAGAREISDFPYIYLQVYNANDNDSYDNNIVGITYNNNPQKDVRTLFTIQTPQALTTASSPNYTTLNTSIVGKIKFLQGYYNLRFRLLDPYYNVILFDNTSYKSTDISAFGTGFVDGRLMNMILDMTFTPF